MYRIISPITYIYPINNWLGIETGVEYSRQTIREETINPNVKNPYYHANFALVDIPLTVRLNFLNYFFANGGLLVDIDAGKPSLIDRQTGLGEILGVGAQYNFKEGIALFVNPYVKFHSNISFSSSGYHRKLLEGGFRFGITYNL